MLDPPRSNRITLPIYNLEKRKDGSYFFAPTFFSEPSAPKGPYGSIMSACLMIAYLHSLIGYCNPADTPMKTLLPALQRAMQVRTSALHLALNIAACAPWPAAQLRHSPPCWVHETANADVPETRTDTAMVDAIKSFFIIDIPLSPGKGVSVLRFLNSDLLRFPSV